MKDWQKAFVLHTRPHSETSLLVDLFIEKKGLLTVLSKGARRKKSSLKGILQPFTPLIVQYSGKGSIKTLTNVEALSLTLPLFGNALYSAFYLNELVHRVIIGESDSIMLFDAYLEAIQSLAKEINCEKVLRRFEFTLLEYLGYHVDFEHCYATGEPIVDSMNYQYRQEQGFIASLIQNSSSYSGKILRSFSDKNFDNIESLKAAKRFIRLALKPYVGSKPFKSRDLFIKP